GVGAERGVRRARDGGRVRPHPAADARALIRLRRLRRLRLRFRLGGLAAAGLADVVRLVEAGALEDEPGPAADHALDLLPGLGIGREGVVGDALEHLEGGAVLAAVDVRRHSQSGGWVETGPVYLPFSGRVPAAARPFSKASTARSATAARTSGIALTARCG